ncbi:MAG: ATP-dependent RecD-like DNA helicase [Actinobacteria bacterium]|nr:ATP-dependent RecD-like DNA helicase [Actinomycetota bacterium]MCL6087935.1 ATP-dependent RecD-like DNA helicase [Actinomycetota bacterium]
MNYSFNPYNPQIKLKGILEKIIYKNPENNYIVARFKIDNENNIETVFGSIIEVNAGEHIEITGEFVNNPKYGRQFKMTNANILPPATNEGIEKYLGSGLIKGVGPATAKKIVSHFKEKTLEILDNDINRLNEIDGFALKRIKKIKEEWAAQSKIKDIMIFLQSLEITPAYAKKIFIKYGNDSINTIRKNPFQLCDDIFGIGFKIADRIAKNAGIEKNSIFRIRAGILYILEQLQEAGNCYFPYELLLNQAKEFLDVEINDIKKTLNILETEKDIIISDNKIYLTQTFLDEKFVAGQLVKLKAEPSKTNLNLISIESQIREISKFYRMEIDEDQQEAIKSAVYEKILIITGSPGTGKSTILNYVLKILERDNKRVKLAAPTGRASKRLSETTGREAKTIHRLLEYNPKLNTFSRNKFNKLSCDLLIIDEASMIDIKLMKNLLEAIDLRTKIIFVGDADQLPSVGPGNVLNDMINSGVFKIVRLNKIYRQFGKSRIIYNAHRIRDGIYPNLFSKADDENVNDFYFIEKQEPEEAVNVILKMLYYNLPQKFGYDPLKDIQILVPVNKGIAGVENLNLKVQEKFNKNSVKIIRGHTEFRLNDKIIQLKNDYEKDVYNGDIGFIRNIDFNLQEFKVDFGDKVVTYNFYDTDEISLSYAISIHKSQGSEFKCVIVPILTSHYMLLQRNLLYTAITRAKELVVLIGSKKAIGMAVSKNNVENRYTRLNNLLSMLNTC